MIQLIIVPYDSGRRGYRMGRGPERLLESGLVGQLAALGMAASSTMIEAEGDAVDSAFDIARRVAAATREAVRNQQVPVILAGNCITTLGAFAGLEARVALLWLDAHADFNTPDTSPSGFLDGMTLAVITGRCYQERSDQVSGFVPLPDSELVLLGTRSIDDGEKPKLVDVAVVQTAEALRSALTKITRDELYLHVDLDVLDPQSLRANQFATPNGLDTATLMNCVSQAAQDKRIAAIAITAYDPATDAADAAPSIVLELLRCALRPA